MANAAPAPAAPAAPAGPTLRTTILATTAALGAVATGTFTALIPTPGDGTATSAAADEPVLGTALTANSASLVLPSGSGATPALLPVTYAADETEGFAAADQHLARLGKASDIAARLAEQLAEEQRQQAEKDRLQAVIAKGGVDGWIAEALRVLDMPQSFAPGIKKVIMAESGGNPRAINNWDSNARRGTPSQGLMQTIPSTFKRYVHPDLADRPITDPIANITAGVRYMVDTYGTDTLQAGGRKSASGSYIGY